MTAAEVRGGLPADAADPDVLARMLAARLSAVLGETLAIEGLHRLTGGASRETWSFTAVPAAGEARRLILRRDPPGAGRPESCDALGEPLPAVEIALRWLAGRRPDAVPDTVVHGDFRTGNLIIDPGGLRAVLDWEVVHRGDPREDLGWLCVKCWRFGSPLAAGGFGTVGQLLHGYAEIAGHRPDPEAVRWWQIYGTARWAVGCRTMAGWHLSGETRSVELAAVGRRVCEQEHDLLLALGVPPDPDDPGAAGEPVPWAELHGRPSAPELVAAVAEFLREEVMPATDGRTGFLARVAANVLDGVERELLLGPDQARRHRERLDALALRDRAALAAAIRSGTLDASDPALLAAVRAEVTDRLAVANPRYA